MLIKVKRFKEYDARMILIDILTGYQELLVNGIIHRDLKPENILINNGKCKIADFGLSKPVNDMLNEKIGTGNIGTIVYMSPQIFCNEFYTSKSDLWTIGLIYF